MAITANKHAGIRAALCWSPDIAALAKQHNNANIIVLPARFISPETAFETLEAFFSAQFEGGRHQRRIDKINI
jgi:ribose 5-phosphate isomerase B